MNRAQALVAVKEKREHTKKALSSVNKITAKETKRLKIELSSCHGIINDLDNGLPFYIKEGFLSTYSAKIKL